MMKRDRIIAFLVIAAIEVTAIVSGAVEAFGADHATMAQRLAKMRGDVEDLTARVDVAKEDMSSRLRSYAGQKADLEMEIQRARMTLKQLEDAREKWLEQVGTDEGRDDAIRPAILSSLGAIKSAVMSGLPFKLDERKADLDRLIRQMDEGMLRPTDAVGRLWDMVEDELRLSRENGLYRQVVDIEGEEILVDVARLGMVMMYYRTRDGRVGKTARKDGGWTFVGIRNKEDKERIWKLFDSFKKQIRVGFFVLPSALPREAVR